MTEKEPDVKIKIGNHEYSLEDAVVIHDKLNKFFNQDKDKKEDGKDILLG